MLDVGHDRALCGSIGAEFVGDDAFWTAALLMQKPHQQAPCGLCIAADLDDFVENVAVLIDGTPEVALLPIDSDDDLIKMPDVPPARRLAL